jgi:hypothetical protein
MHTVIEQGLRTANGRNVAFYQIAVRTTTGVGQLYINCQIPGEVFLSGNA